MATGGILTGNLAIDHARYTIGGAGYEFPGHVDPLGLVNEAGDYLTSCHKWNWLRRTRTSLNARKDVAFLKLPTDFKAMVAPEKAGSLYRLEMISPAQMQELESFGVLVSGLDTYGTVTWTSPPKGGPPVPQIDIYPTPATSEKGAYTIVYEAGWRCPEEASERLTLPTWLTSVFLDILVAVARGRVEEDGGSVAQRMQGIKNSDLFLAATERDDQSQALLGAPSGMIVPPGGHAQIHEISFVEDPS